MSPSEATPPSAPPPSPPPLLLCCLHAPIWVVCTLRLACAAIAAVTLPLIIPLSGPLPTILNAEAAFLLASCLLLPLPLKHHLWVQLLALRSAVARTRRLAWLHAVAREHAAQCTRYVQYLRLAMMTVVPGAPVQLHGLPPGDSCWMVHIWLAVVVGYALPAAVLAALAQHKRWQRQQQEQLVAHLPSRGERTSSSGSSTGNGKGSGTWSAKHVVADRHQHRGAPASLHPDGGAAAGGSPNGSRGRSSSSSDRALSSLLPAGIAASDVSRCSSSSLSEASAGTGGTAGTHPAQQPTSAPAAHLAAALQQVVHLFQWLTLLLPVGALAWAALEVVAQYAPAAGAAGSPP